MERGSATTRGYLAGCGARPNACHPRPQRRWKTTLLSILSGRLSPRAGSVNLDSRPLISYSARERSRLIAFLPQLEKLAFNYRVLDFVLMGRTPCMEVLALPGKEDEEAALKALSLFGLDSFSMRNIGELSGGEFQLVRIARCLAQGASILILDEPASCSTLPIRIADALASLVDWQDDNLHNARYRPSHFSRRSCTYHLRRKNPVDRRGGWPRQRRHTWPRLWHFIFYKTIAQRFLESC